MHKKKREVLRFLKSTLKQMENNDRFSAHEKGGHLPTGEYIFNAKETQDCLQILEGLAVRLMSLCEASNAEDSNGQSSDILATCPEKLQRMCHEADFDHFISVLACSLRGD